MLEIGAASRGADLVWFRPGYCTTSTTALVMLTGLSAAEQLSRINAWKVLVVDSASGYPDPISVGLAIRLE